MLELDALKAALNDGEGRPPCPYLARLRHAAQDSSELILSMDAVVIPSPPAANGGGAGGGGGWMTLELHRLLRALPSRCLSPLCVGAVASCLADALSHLHACHVAHRDVKPRNVCLRHDGTPVLVDFGCARRLLQAPASSSGAAGSGIAGCGAPAVTSEGRRKSLVGTLPFVAPEVLARSGHGLECDWWSLGVMIHLALVGEYPFPVDADGGDSEPGITHAELVEAHRVALAAGDGSSLPVSRGINGIESPSSSSGGPCPGWGLPLLLRATLTYVPGARADSSAAWAVAHGQGGVNSPHHAAGLAALRKEIEAAAASRCEEVTDEGDAEAAARAQDERETLDARAEAAWRRRSIEQQEALFKGYSFVDAAAPDATAPGITDVSELQPSAASKKQPSAASKEQPSAASKEQPSAASKEPEEASKMLEEGKEEGTVAVSLVFKSRSEPVSIGHHEDIAALFEAASRLFELPQEEYTIKLIRSGKALQPTDRADVLSGSASPPKVMVMASAKAAVAHLLAKSSLPDSRTASFAAEHGSKRGGIPQSKGVRQGSMRK